MGNDIQKGTIYAEGGVGGSGTVNAANLNAHVDEARIKSTFISSKSLKDPASLADAFVVENSGVLYRETMQQVMDLINLTIQGLLPVGTIVDFAGANAPDGWLLCFGQAISRDTWSQLFSIIGVTYGSGNGVDTFNVPDLRGRVGAGKDNMGGTGAGRIGDPTVNVGLVGTTLGSVGGLYYHALVVGEMANHNHSTPDHLHYCVGVDHLHVVPNHTHPITVFPSYQSLANGGTRAVQWDTQTGGNTGGSGNFNTTGSDRGLGFWSGAADRSLATDYRGSNAAHNNVQPTMMLNKIIRAQS